ncbi:MAG: TetM/TetW/TetO/TetS family tetracycline resistance ribosomal protection protein, partial [Clostridia bacterium]|nr:TetM/TetW/TetO/TetS family tetracycline resistance ribosomal protection protein [Clostridia bacterium]
MDKLAVGILAHVDAGKTTLSEAMLYRGGRLKKLGRVDHQDAFLDTDALERERGITIFSKLAVLPLRELEVTLLDTPGHVDFSSEMERTLPVLDCAILVVSGSDGVQGHTETLWRLLKRYHVPTFLFINKMDLHGPGREALLSELKARLDDGCVDFPGEDEAFYERVALCDETVLERYMDSGAVSGKDISALIGARKLFPCYFGSALKLEGVDEFLEGLERYAPRPRYGAEFGARVYKIARDVQGTRLTYLKVTGGSLRVKALLSGEGWEEKADQLRVYSGAKFQPIDEAGAGTVCAVTGLTRTYPGQGLGFEEERPAPVLESVLTYQAVLPEGCDPHVAMGKLKTLEEEDPQLRIVWSARLREIHIQLMGEVQLEILKRVIAERFGLEVEFGSGSIVYKETIANTVEGVGHYEPLRHYAEVHLILEPGERGSGMRFAASCPDDMLDRNWQRLVLTHLMEKQHLGVLTGSPITDVKITLAAGRAHLKHTEGGDFRQATYRAVRQGLMQAESVLLEPWYDFRLELPAEQVGRAISDIQRMYGTCEPPETAGDRAVLNGSAPVAALRGYAVEVAAYTSGRGRLFCTLRGYEP